MQTQSPQTPATPARPTVVVTGPGGGADVISIPQTLSARDIAMIKARREELSNQLQSVDGRRGRLLSQLQGTGDETARKGLEDRIALLDKRQLQLESDIAETGRQLSSAPAGFATAASSAQYFGGFDPDSAAVLSGIFFIFVLAPLAVGAAMAMLRRSKRPPVPTAALTETAERLARIEQAVDAIALEVERVTEGQRFVTKLLSDGSGALALPAAQRKPEPVRAGE